MKYDIKTVVGTSVQMTDEKYGAEPTIQEMIENYYEPHFPDTYKELAVTYIQKLSDKLNKKQATHNFNVGDKVIVVNDKCAGTPLSIIADGIHVGSIGVVVNCYDFVSNPIAVQFENVDHNVILFPEEIVKFEEKQ